MKTLIAFAILLLFQTCGWAQPNLDSLWAVWSDVNQPDTSRLKAIHDYTVDGHLYSQPDSAFLFAQLHYDFAKSKGLKKEMGRALQTQGVSHSMRGEYSKAIDCFSRGLTILEKIGEKKHVGKILNSLGIVFADQGDYTKAINYLNRSLVIDEEFEDKESIAITLNNMGLVCYGQSKYAKAIDYYYRSLVVLEEVGNKMGVSYILSNIGMIYSDLDDFAMAVNYYTRSLTIREEIGDKNGVAASLGHIGNMYYSLNDYPKAIDFFTRSLTLHEEFGDRIGIAMCLGNIGLVYSALGDYTKSLDFHTRSLVIEEELGFRRGITASLTSIAVILLELGKLEEAVEYASRGLSIAQEIGDLREVLDATEALYKTHKSKGDHYKALEMFELHIQMRDSIASEKNIKEMARFEFKYEYNKKALSDSLRTLAANEALAFNHQLEVAQKETERNLYASGGLVLLLVTFFFFQRKTNRNKLLLKEKEADYQREVLYATINSQESERRRIARDLHDEVGAMLSTIKLNLGTVEMQLKQAGLSEQLTSPARNLVDETINNVRGISKNLLPPTLEEFGLAHALSDLAEKVEEASGIPFKKDIQTLNQRLPIEHELALFRVIQEMINNALKHAEATEFTLTLREQNGQLNLSFADNGKGFDLETIKKSNSGKTGLGLKNLENRVGVVGGKMEYESRLGKGTSIEIRVSMSNQMIQAA